MNKRELLQSVKEKERQFKALESQLESAKEGYHQAIRQMHVEGMSLREIAISLNLSHQRVHQIVESENKGWRAWLRPVTPELKCSFCGRSSEQAKKLVAGPNIFMCDACALGAAQTLKSETAAPTKKDGFSLLDKAARLRCSFCAKLPSYQRAVVAGKDHQICAKCIELSLDYMKEPPAPPVDELKKTRVKLSLQIENNSKFVRGKKKAREIIEIVVLRKYWMNKLSDWEYELTVSYKDDSDLDSQIIELFNQCEHFADMRNCFAECDCEEIGTDRYW